MTTYPSYRHNEETGEWEDTGRKDIGIDLDDAWRVMNLTSAPITFTDMCSRSLRFDRKLRRRIGRNIRNAQKEARQEGLHLSAKQIKRIRETA